jgi:hypothetical protein
VPDDKFVAAIPVTSFKQIESLQVLIRVHVCSYCFGLMNPLSRHTKLLNKESLLSPRLRGFQQLAVPGKQLSNSLLTYAAGREKMD